MKKVRLPSTVVLELTYRCNHQCKFCSCPWYAPSSSYPVGHELDTDQWMKAIDILYAESVSMFTLSGGEALLKEGFTDILRYIWEKGKQSGCRQQIAVISNGRAMTMEYLELFRELDVQLSMSLPGYETFEYHTGVDNADGVLHWFKEAEALGVNTTVNVTVTQRNIHELFQTLSLGLISGANSLLLNRFLPGGRGLAHWDELKLTRKQTNEMLDVAEEVLGYSNRFGSVGTEIPLCAIIDPKKYQHLNIGYQCAAAKGFFVVDPSGNIRTCNHSPRIVGHIFNESVMTDIAYWNMFAAGDYQPEMCSRCKLSPLCDCGCREVAHILHGNPKAKDTSIICDT